MQKQEKMEHRNTRTIIWRNGSVELSITWIPSTTVFVKVAALFLVITNMWIFTLVYPLHTSEGLLDAAGSHFWCALQHPFTSEGLPVVTRSHFTPATSGYVQRCSEMPGGTSNLPVQTRSQFWSYPGGPPRPSSCRFNYLRNLVSVGGPGTRTHCKSSKLNQANKQTT